jgi:hypothetical protein
LHSLFRSENMFLSLVLSAAAVHSFAVGSGLLLQHAVVLHWAGFAHFHEAFFPAQGGMFHILMVVPCVLGALWPARMRNMIFFAIPAKALVTVFLVSSVLFVSPVWMVLISGLTHGRFAVFICAASISRRRRTMEVRTWI